MNYKFNEETMFMDISDGIAVVINTVTGIYYGFNGFATDLFKALTCGADTDQIKAALREIPYAPAGIAEDFDAFVEKLVSFELLLPAEAGDTVYTPDGRAAEADSFKMELEAYDDAQEMLMADPIHEVKIETGWTPETESIGYSKEETREREKKVKIQ